VVGSAPDCLGTSNFIAHARWPLLPGRQLQRFRLGVAFRSTDQEAVPRSGETENWWALAAVPQTWSRSIGCGRWSKQAFAAGAERLAESL